MYRVVEDDMPPLPECVTPLLEDFLRACFHKDPTLRPSAEVLYEHEWLNKRWCGLQVRCLLSIFKYTFANLSSGAEYPPPR